MVVKFGTLCSGQVTDHPCQIDEATVRGYSPSMTLQLTTSQEKRLEHLAAQSHRTRDELALEAIDLYLQHVESLTAEVRAAEEEADRQGWQSSRSVLERIQTRFSRSAWR